MLLGVVIFVGDHEDPHGLVRRLMDTLPPGSHLVLPHHHQPGHAPADVTRFFDGLDRLDPDAVSCNHWRPDPSDEPLPDEVAMCGGVGRRA